VGLCTKGKSETQLVLVEQEMKVMKKSHLQEAMRTLHIKFIQADRMDVLIKNIVRSMSFW